MSVDQSQHDRSEIHLHLGMLVQIIEHNLGIYIGTKLDDNPHALPVRFITKRGNPVNDFLAG